MRKVAKRMKVISIRGVTLIEILVAISLLVVIGGSCFVAYRSATDTLERSDAKTQRVQSARNALDLIANDLRSAFISNDIYRLIENAGGLYMTTNSVVKSTGSDISQVRYYWAASNLYRVEAVSPSDPAGAASNPTADYLLVSRDIGCSVTGFSVQFGYYNTSARNPNSDWVWTTPDTQMNWDSASSAAIDGNENYSKSGLPKSPNGLPEAVRIGLALQDEKNLESAQTFYTIIYLPGAE